MDQFFCNEKSSYKDFSNNLYNFLTEYQTMNILHLYIYISKNSSKKNPRFFELICQISNFFILVSLFDSNFFIQ